MESLRPSETTTGSPTLSTSKVTEDLPTSDAQLPTQDGGNYSDSMELSSGTSKTIR
jgi:hypothetical protein